METDALSVNELLGYRIEQRAPLDPHGRDYCVICPLTGEVLSQFSDLGSAHRHILQLELHATCIRPPHPAY